MKIKSIIQGLIIAAIIVPALTALAVTPPTIITTVQTQIKQIQNVVNQANQNSLPPTVFMPPKPVGSTPPPPTVIQQIQRDVTKANQSNLPPPVIKPAKPIAPCTFPLILTPPPANANDEEAMIIWKGTNASELAGNQMNKAICLLNVNGATPQEMQTSLAKFKQIFDRIAADTKTALDLYHSKNVKKQTGPAPKGTLKGPSGSLPIDGNFAAVLMDTLTSPFKWLLGK